MKNMLHTSKNLFKVSCESVSLALLQMAMLFMVLNASETLAQSLGFTGRGQNLPPLSVLSRCSASWVDIDNDGRLDFAYTGGDALGGPVIPRTLVYRQGGDGTFAQFSTGLPVVQNGCLVWGDYDGDGYPDAYISGVDEFAAEVGAIYHNDGDGTFTLVIGSLPAALGGDGASWGDYDEDGDLDLVVAGASGTDVFRNNAGSFVALSAGLAQESGMPLWADYDHDGDLDIILASEGMFAGSFRIYSNNGAGIFSDTSFVLPDLPEALTSAYVAFDDYEGDGDKDLLYLGKDGTGSFSLGYIYLNDGHGVFTQYSAGLSNVLGWVDYDSDGDMDPYGNGLHINNFPTAIDYNVTHPFPNAGINTAMAWGDYDGDGDRDFFYVGEGSGGFGAGDIVNFQAVVFGEVKMASDDSPLEGVLLSSTALGSSTTASDGSYAMTGAAPLTQYTLTPSLDGYAFTPASYSGTLQGLKSISFTATLAYDISGTILVGSAPYSGVTVDGGALGQVVTDVNGQYRFDNVAVGTSYTLALTSPLSGYVFLPENAAGTLTADVVHNFQADGCPSDSNKAVPGICGCGVVEDIGDLDQDSIPNCLDTSDDSCHLSDADNDGVDACQDMCPNDVQKTTPGQCGCGVSEDVGDSDNDGVLNCLDASDDSDGDDGDDGDGDNDGENDGDGDNDGQDDDSNGGDDDTDGDGTTDDSDQCPADANKIVAGVCGCGVVESLIDTDGDKLRDCVDSDDDNDGAGDVDEGAAGTNPLDRGSRTEAPDTRSAQSVCAEWNSHAGVAWNYLEQMNASSRRLALRTTLYGSDGKNEGSIRYRVPHDTSVDLAVHELSGWQDNSSGQVCTGHDKGEGNFDGQMVYYKPLSSSLDLAAGVDFAYVSQLSNGVPGKQWLSYNTFHPDAGSDAISRGVRRGVSNWMQIRNMEGSRQRGQLVVYDQKGRRVAVQDVRVKARGRYDFDIHRFGANRLGSVKWLPENSRALFQFNNVRYYHSAAELTSSINAATSLQGDTGVGELIAANLDNTDGASVVELLNTSGRREKVAVAIYNSSGAEVWKSTIVLPANGSHHIVTDGLLGGEVGSVRLKGEYREGVAAFILKYGRLSDLSLKYAYSESLREPDSSELRGLYNTHLGQSCRVLLSNVGNNVSSGSTTSKVNVEMKLIRRDGKVMTSADKITLKPQQTAVADICSHDETNSSGMLLIKPKGKIVASLLRLGNDDRYRFQTTLR